MKGKYLVGLLFLVTTINLSANTEYSCVGKIDYIQQTYSGKLHLISSEIYGDSLPRKVCSFNEELNGVSVNVCEGWFSKLLATKALSAELSVQYRDDKTCSTQPSHSASLQIYSLR